MELCETVGVRFLGSLSARFVPDGLKTVDDDESARRQRKMESAVRTLLECVGEDPDREGLVQTPARLAKALMYFTKGYGETLKDIVSQGIFEVSINCSVRLNQR